MADTTLEIQEDYWEGIAERRSPEHPVVRAFATPKLDFIVQTVDPNAKSMLEVGAGNGFFSYTFQEAFDLTCLDFSKNMLAMNPLPEERKVQGLAEELPFETGSFDIVFCGNLLHHLVDPVVAVREMARVARKHVLLLEPNAQNPLMYLFGLLKKPERGTLKFTPQYLRSLAYRSGLRLRAATSQGSILPNKTPHGLLAMTRRFDGQSPLGFYLIAVFDK
jgi:SAM-dependent methyltransferase